MSDDTPPRGLRAVFEHELPPFQPSLWLTRLMLALLPDYSFVRIRATVLQLAGWKVGEGASLFGSIRMYGRGPVRQRLSIGCWTMINVRCTLELNERVTIGDHAAIGHEVLILTSTHRMGRHVRRAGHIAAQPVTIGDGAWIGSRAVILPGVTIGDGAVVMAGSVVNADVAPDSIVGGIPARTIVPRLPG